MASSHIQDGKWSWLVCLSATMSWFAAMGIVFSFGIFFPVFMDYFQESRQKTGMNLFKLTFWPRRFCYSQGPPYPSSEWERGEGVWGVRFALVLNFFMPTVCDQNQREEYLPFVYSSTLNSKLHVPSVQKKLCMQNICLVMIMWAGPGTLIFLIS